AKCRYMTLASWLWCFVFFFFSSRRRHTRFSRDWSSDVCSSDLDARFAAGFLADAVLSVLLAIYLIVAGAIVLKGSFIGARLHWRSEERRVGKECRSRGAPEH